jgi:hypothetical protein
MMMMKDEKGTRRHYVDRTAFLSLVIATFHLFSYTSSTTISTTLLLPNVSALEGSNYIDSRGLAWIGQESQPTTTANSTLPTEEDGTLKENNETVSFGSNEVGVWLYSSKFARLQNWIIDDLLQRNINTIYFSEVGDGDGWDDPDKASQYTSFINYARANGMKVFGVALEDPTYVLMNERGLNAAFGDFINKTKYMFDTYVIDVEVHSINTIYPKGEYLAYTGNEKFYLEKYIQMSKILRNIADEHGVRYIDTIPPSYHTQIIADGIATDGVNQLSSHSINVMAYENTVEKTMTSISQILADSKIRLVININIAQESSEPYLEGQEIPQAIKSLKEQSLPIGIWYADHYLLNSDPALNLDPTLFGLSPR